MGANGALHYGEDLGGLGRQIGRKGGAVELRGDASGELEMLSAPGQGSRIRGRPREAAPLDLSKLRPDGRLGLVARRGVHCRANGAVQAGAVDTLGDAVGDRVLGAREVQRDAVVRERAGHVLERLEAGGVDVRHSLGVQDERGRDG